MARLFRVILPVTDIERATTFYATLLGSVGRRVSPGRHYFDCEGTILACLDPASDGDGYAATPIPEPIYVAFDDLDAAFERALAAGATRTAAARSGTGDLGVIADRPWGERSAYVTDPFGNPLCLVGRATMFFG